MVHTIYVTSKDFEDVIKAHECDVETFLLDPEIIADDYVIFVDKETKKRTMLKVFSSQFTDRRSLHQKLDVKSNDEALTHIIENRKELEETRIKYQIKTEKCMNIISMPIKLQDDELDEFLVVVVSESGIYVELKNKRFSFPERKMNVGQKIEDIVNTLGDERELIPLMDYSNKIGNETKQGRVYLLQSECMVNSAMELITPSKNSRHMITETFAFNDSFSRYLFFLLESLFKNEDLPELELKGEPKILGEFINNRIRCLSDITDIYYSDFTADNYVLYIQPYLTKSMERERTSLIPKNEKNYKEVMDLFYEDAFLGWALDYDEGRTLSDERVKRMFE